MRKATRVGGLVLLIAGVTFAALWCAGPCREGGVEQKRSPERDGDAEGPLLPSLSAGNGGRERSVNWQELDPSRSGVELGKELELEASTGRLDGLPLMWRVWLASHVQQLNFSPAALTAARDSALRLLAAVEGNRLPHLRQYGLNTDELAAWIGMLVIAPTDVEMRKISSALGEALMGRLASIQGISLRGVWKEMLRQHSPQQSDWWQLVFRDLPSESLGVFAAEVSGVIAASVGRQPALEFLRQMEPWAHPETGAEPATWLWSAAEALQPFTVSGDIGVDELLAARPIMRGVLMSTVPEEQRWPVSDAPLLAGDATGAALAGLLRRPEPGLDAERWRYFLVRESWSLMGPEWTLAELRVASVWPPQDPQLYGMRVVAALVALQQMNGDSLTAKFRSLTLDSFNTLLDEMDTRDLPEWVERVLDSMPPVDKHTPSLLRELRQVLGARRVERLPRELHTRLGSD